MLLFYCFVPVLSSYEHGFLALAIAPIASVFVLCVFYDVAVIYHIRPPYPKWFMISAILLLFSNLIVFAVYEATQKINMQFTQLQLEMQKEKISSEYYKLLQTEYENTRILSHDLKGHFRVIKELATEDRKDEIIGYVENLSSDFHVNKRIAYTQNPYVDVVLNRYAQLCQEQSIRLYMNIRRVSFEFMSGGEITALLDNLMSNAVEAAADSAEKLIELAICEKNDNYVVINLRNSCDKAPRVKNSKLLSHKQSERLHGFGFKSMQRITLKYDGDVRWSYKSTKATFDLRVILKKRTLL